MLSQKTKTTNRKFYNKWLYKASFRLEGCAIFRNKSLDEIRSFCAGPAPEEKYHWSFWTRAYTNKEIIDDIAVFLESYNKDIYSLRIESSMFDLYTNNKDLYDLVSNRFEEILRHRFEPSSANIDLLEENKNYITVEKLPKGRYNYRVYLLPHKMKGDREGKQKYLDWIKRQTPKITCTPAVEKWFLSTDWNWDRRYVLVEDEATLLMLKLRNSEVVGKIYNFVISDK